MTELARREDIQTVLQTMDEFDNADVTLGDYSVLDGSIHSAPYCIVESAEVFELDLTGEISTVSITYDIDVVLFVQFIGWRKTAQSISEIRYKIMEKFSNDSGVLPNEGDISVQLRNISNGSPIDSWPVLYSAPKNKAEATPSFLYQALTFSVLEY